MTAKKKQDEERIVDSYLVHEVHPELIYFSDSIIKGILHFFWKWARFTTPSEFFLLRNQANKQINNNVKSYCKLSVLILDKKEQTDFCMLWQK